MSDNKNDESSAQMEIETAQKLEEESADYFPISDSSDVESSTKPTAQVEATSNNGCSMDTTVGLSEAQKIRNDENADEIEQTEKVINAMKYYRRYGHARLKRHASVFRRLSKEHQLSLSPQYSEHLKVMKECVTQNQRVLKQILLNGLEMFGCDSSLQMANDITQLRPSEDLFMSKVRSTLKQIVRDWSEEGVNERSACYGTVISALQSRYPDKDNRSDINILVPGAGLGRLAWQLVVEGFSVQGNEFSLFMLFASNFILNKCQKVNEFTIYPYVLDTCNNWTYEDQTRPIHFPDMLPAALTNVRSNTFSMSAGDFMQTTANDDGNWSVVITMFFIDTATNVINYIDTIHRILKKGGVWINLGPLMYHFADMEEEDSIELPYSEVMRLIETKGFKIERDDRHEKVPKTFYAGNVKSMLRYEYSSGFFECVKQ